MSSRRNRSTKPRKGYDPKKKNEIRGGEIVRRFWGWLLSVGDKDTPQVNLLPFTSMSFHKSKCGAKRRQRRKTAA